MCKHNHPCARTHTVIHNKRRLRLPHKLLSDNDAPVPAASALCTYHIGHIVMVSGKMHCLQILLSSILKSPSEDKVVVVSNSTSALDLIQALCEQHSYGTVRIDGATNINKRQDIVNSFNAAYGQAQVQTLVTDDKPNVSNH